MVILLDKDGNIIGSQEKMAAHVDGSLHLAFSVFVFDSQGRILLQKRASDKYHSGGLWTNTCCSHPVPGENIEEAAHRRLMYEMGMDCKLYFVDKFTYRAELDNGLTEHETDYIFIGISDKYPLPHPEEVEGFRYSYPEDIRADILRNPSDYTEWFRIIMDRYGEIIEDELGLIAI